MSEKMPDRQKALIVNVAILAALSWCYFKGYSLTIVVIVGIALLATVGIVAHRGARRAQHWIGYP